MRPGPVFALFNQLNVPITLSRLENHWLPELGPPHFEKHAFWPSCWQYGADRKMTGKSGWHIAGDSPLRLSLTLLIRTKTRKGSDRLKSQDQSGTVYPEFLRARFYVSTTCRWLNPSREIDHKGHFWTFQNGLTLLPNLRLSLNSEAWLKIVDGQSFKMCLRGSKLLKPLN